MKGMLISIYKSGRDCTNGGASSRDSWAYIVGAGVPEIHDVTKGDHPVFRFVPRPGFYGPILVPEDLVVKDDAGQPVHGHVGFKTTSGVMFGGNYGCTSDSRFGELLRQACGWPHAPIAIHDRVER